MPNAEEIKALLTGQRAAFEVVSEEVNGVEMLVYKDRMKALREISRLAMNRGQDDIFLVYGDERISYPEFIKRADVIGESLSQYGVKKGDRIAVLSANNPQWCLTFWATVDSAAVLVGLNGWWKSDEIIYGLNQSGSKVLVADRNRFKRIAGDLKELTTLEYIFIVDPTDEDLKIDSRVHSFVELETSFGEPVDDPLERVIVEDDPAVIFYTSGTTGRPKGAVSTHRSMIANLQNSFYAAIAGALASPGKGIMPDSGTSQLSSLLTSPLFHVSGCHSGLVVALASGMKLVIPVGRLDPEKILSIIQDEKINIWTGVPTVVWRVVEEASNYQFDLTSLKSVAYGGSPSGADLMKRVKETFPNVKAMGNGYGLTESSSIATINSGEDLEMHPDSVGRTLPVVELAIVDESGEFVDRGQTGEVWIRGPIIMPGYWENKEATDDIISDGWLHSGDVGYV
ncbi:MAG: acyl--CoA ligase, partial [Acidimicrobiales bacterium]|nr:acyl--CoA ligase [Acidimicrobiales bacterium]